MDTHGAEWESDLPRLPNSVDLQPIVAALSMHSDRPQNPYDAAFFDWQVDGALRSARVLLPILLEYLQPRSVLDVGCGRGAWLRVFQELGITDVMGLDGDYVDRSSLMISVDRFRPIDLEHPKYVEGTFDLSICLEVGEHLPPRASRQLVDLLASMSPAVLFSAAVPGQGGTHHINERWPSYWHALFASHQFRPLDIVRPRILGDRRVDWWYRQNTLLYVSQPALSRWPKLSAAASESPDATMEWVHVSLLRSLSVKALIQFFRLDLFQRLGRRLRSVWFNRNGRQKKSGT